jgi:hypothetical protein
MMDFAKWLQEQRIEAGLGNPDEDGMHLASLADGTRYWELPPGGGAVDEAGVTRWTIKEFDDDYAPSAGDEENKLLVSTKATAVNLIMSPDRFETGSQLTVFQYGAGQITIVKGTGVEVRTPETLTFNEQYGSVTFIQVYPNDWMIAGRMTPA